MDRVLLTGGGGLVGRRLTELALEQGLEVAVLTRHSKPASGTNSVPSFHWDPVKGTLDPAALEYAGRIIHLAGANIGKKRWTSRRKQEILDSRIRTAACLKLHIDRAGLPPATFITASATGYYGSVSGKRPFMEDDPPGKDFAARVCREWEAAADQFSSLGTRVLKIRSGVVLSSRGGALPRLARMTRLGLCHPLGTGRQFFPWIHLDDLCRVFLHALGQKEMAGAFNAVAPEPVRNREFIRALCRQAGRGYLLPPIPSFLLRLALGEMSAMLTKGSPISSAKLLETGFSFGYPGLSDALAHIYPQSSRILDPLSSKPSNP